MSVGLSLIKSIVETQDRATYRDLKARFFIENEVEAFNYMTEHVQQYGVFPSLETLQENSVSFRRVRSPEPPRYYLDRVLDRSAYNEVRPCVTELGTLMGSRTDMDEARSVIRQMYASIERHSSEADDTPISTLATDLREEYEQARAEEEMIGITLGWPHLDEVTAGAQDGDIVAVVGRPGVGKTNSLIYMATRAWLENKSILIVSMEMTTEQIGRRFVSMLAGVNPDLVRRGQLGDEGERRYFEWLDRLESGDTAPCVFVSGSLDKKVSEIDMLIQQYSPDVAYVDGAYLLKASVRRSGGVSRREQIADVFEELKQIMLRRNIPAIVTTQFNRLQKMKAKVMSLDNIGETDVIGQIVSIAIGVSHGRVRGQEESTRFYSIMKDRESGTSTFTTNYRFDPPDFNFVCQGYPGEDNEGQERIVNSMSQSNLTREDI